MADKPLLHLLVLVGGIVVEDDVNDLAGRDLPLDGIQEADELLMSVLLSALTDDRAVKRVEGGEQGGGAVAFVIMGERAASTFLHRQAGLGTIERLNLRLLVNRQHHRMGRRVDIEPDHIGGLVDEGRIVGQFE